MARHHLQGGQVPAASDGVGRNEPDPCGLSRRDLPSCFLEPVADEISPGWYALGVGAAKPGHVLLAELPDLELGSQKRRIADHDIRLRPVRFGVVRRQDRVAAFDGVERLQDRVVRLREPVTPHPLDFADPDRDAGQLSGIGIDLEALHVGRADFWKRPPEA